ncbi:MULTISPECIES: subclass B1 metallo-beta-lactamase [Chryseobacterium]|uniref:beta-lactamase n=1 Tax=Chryseobacterium taihuense TaxID=1141221 RepID=A0A4U8WHS0_9FLAO|nr:MULTISPECIES: subclass B1 metallo-beta-lactamase [Chryseobacterium]QQV01456.1 subclass B1 metallo-beta-lactamase [Chryseobacterium sp. FDAARGOS 1104]VFB05356.1 Beta-lactamase type II precursor [Chryseobacterium taihuense]
MKPIVGILISLFIFLSCHSQKSSLKKNKIVYQSENLKIIRLSNHVYQHISYLNTESFGRVECNGMVVKDKDETIVFDTPVDDKSSSELIFWIKDSLHSKINAVIATHFHDDCVGGLKEFNKNRIPSYANNKTIELTKINGFNTPQNGFDSQLTLMVGNQHVYAEFLGEGHTRDNIIGYFPKEKAMFGGCLIKEMNATKGYLGDANVKDWSETVAKVKTKFSDVRIIVPGHGNAGGTELLDYTIQLFKQE